MIADNPESVEKLKGVNLLLKGEKVSKYQYINIDSQYFKYCRMLVK